MNECWVFDESYCLALTSLREGPCLPTNIPKIPSISSGFHSFAAWTWSRPGSHSTYAYDTNDQGVAAIYCHVHHGPQTSIARWIEPDRSWPPDALAVAGGWQKLSQECLILCLVCASVNIHDMSRKRYAKRILFKTIVSSVRVAAKAHSQILADLKNDGHRPIWCCIVLTGRQYALGYFIGIWAKTESLWKRLWKWVTIFLSLRSWRPHIGIPVTSLLP